MTTVTVMASASSRASQQRTTGPHTGPPGWGLAGMACRRPVVAVSLIDLSFSSAVWFVLGGMLAGSATTRPGHLAALADLVRGQERREQVTISGSSSPDGSAFKGVLIHMQNVSCQPVSSRLHRVQLAAAHLLRGLAVSVSAGCTAVGFQ